MLTLAVLVSKMGLTTLWGQMVSILRAVLWNNVMKGENNFLQISSFFSQGVFFFLGGGGGGCSFYKKKTRIWNILTTKKVYQKMTKKSTKKSNF